MSFFSIITVCLNSGDNLKNTVNSILTQENADFELIIKDGGSNDNSLDQIPLDNRIKLIISVDSGIYDAMNQALSYAAGEYILFLNSGDYFYDRFVLDSFYNSITNNDFPGLIYCDYTTTGLGEYVQSPLKLTKFFLFRTMLCHQVCMIKKELYDRIGNFNTDYRVDADYDFLLRLLLENKTSYHHIQTLGVISTSEGFSFQNNTLAKQEVLQIRKKYYRHTYLSYAFLLSLTFPSLREKLFRSTNLVSRLYQRFVNVINRLL